MSRALKPIPEFANEGDERAYWESHDSTDHLEWSTARAVAFPKARDENDFIAPASAFARFDQGRS